MKLKRKGRHNCLLLINITTEVRILLAADKYWDLVHTDSSKGWAQHTSHVKHIKIYNICIFIFTI